MVKKLPRWQREQKQRRVSRRKSIIGRALVFAIIILAVGLSVGFYGVLKKSVWDGQTQISLAVASRPVSLVSFSPLGPSLVFLTFPEDAYIEAVHGYGNYLIESVYPLGELEGRGRGGELLSQSLQEHLGVAVEGYLFGADLKETKESFLENILGLLKNQGQTNLGRWDLLRLWWEARSVREDRVRLVKLDKPLDSERLERIIGQYFVDEKIRAEALTISVLNNTNQPGLAAREARIIKNLGGRIIGLGDIENKQSLSLRDEKCQMASQKKYKNSHTVKRLTKIFGCPWRGENLFGQRADVVLILGEMI